MEFLAHTLTWEELVKLAMRRKTITTAQGYLMSSKDREFVPNDAGRHAYYDAVKVAVERGDPVPFGVRAAHELRQIEKEIGVVSPRALKNRMPRPKPFTWSFTALQQYDTCANQYAAERFLGVVKFKETEATKWGSRCHKALEVRLKYGTPLPDGMKQWEKYCAKFEAVAKKLEAKIHPELQLTTTRNFGLTGWFDGDAHGRCALDVVIDAGKTVYIYDWKTGKKKDNLFQLQVCAAMAALKFPEAENFVVRYIWLQEEGAEASSGTEVHVSEIAGIWNLIVEKIAQVELSWETEEFPCRPSGLCYGWCGHEDCPHWKPKK